MAQISYQDSPTVNLGGSGTADDPITAKILPFGTACEIINDPEAVAKLKAAINTNAVIASDDNGNLLITPMDGVTDPYTVELTYTPPESAGATYFGTPYLDLAAAQMCFPRRDDVDNVEIAPACLDLSGLFALLTSTPHPEIQASGSVSAAYDAAQNLWMIEGKDRDTVCTFRTEDGAVIKTVSVYENGTLISSEETEIDIPTMTDVEICDALLRTMGDPARRVAFQKAATSSVPPVDVQVGDVPPGSEDGTLFFDAAGLGKLQVFDAAPTPTNPNGCLKPFEAYECMCIRLPDGSLLEYLSGTWTPKQTPAMDLVDTLCSDADAIAALKEKIDVRATALEFSRFSGLATLTLSDGTELTTEIATPEPGTYAPNSNGNVIIPLSGGGNLVLTGLVSEPDVDISEFNVTDEGDGLFTVTPMLSSGDTLAPFSLGSDDRLNTLALGPDGCTLTGTLVSGIEASVPLCDLVPALEQDIDPATGAVTTTYTDPLTGAQTVWTIQPEVRFVDEGDGTSTITFSDGTELCIANNPVTKCEQGGCDPDGSSQPDVILTRKDGSQSAISADIDQVRTASWSRTGYTDSPEDAPILLAALPISHNSHCRKRLRLTGQMKVRLRALAGQVIVKNEITANGTSITIGGGHGVNNSYSNGHPTNTDDKLENLLAWANINKGVTTVIEIYSQITNISTGEARHESGRLVVESWGTEKCDV